MNLIHTVTIILAVVDAGIFVLVHRLDRIMYKPSVFMHLEPVNSNLFLNREYDEPITRLLLSTGGKLVAIIVLLTVTLIKLAR